MEHPFDVSPEVIILDLCGTILDSRAVDRRIMDQVGSKYAGKPYSELRKTKDPRLSMRANFRNFFGKYEHEAYKEYIQRLNATVHSTQPFLGVFDFLKTAQAQGVRLCVVTNRLNKLMCGRCTGDERRYFSCVRKNEGVGGARLSAAKA